MSHRPRPFATNVRSAAGAVAVATWLTILAGAGHAQALSVPGEAAQPAVVAVAASVETTGPTTRISFDLSRAVDAHATPLDSPDRLVVDLPQVNFQIDPAVGRLKTAAGGLIKSFRFGLFAPGRSRIILDLAAPATLVRVGSASIAGGDPSRLTIDLAHVDRATFHKAVVAAAAAQPAAPAAAVRPVEARVDRPAATTRPIVVIDPGHGGVDPGASGIGGVVEKTITFDFATMLADKLNASGHYQAILTRKDDSFVSLGERVAIAREANAALFISIHADTVAASGSVTGATVYTCSDRASDAEAARVAANENNADEAAGVEATPASSDVNDILFDLTRRETRTYAHLFQRTLIGYWQKIAKLNKNPERAAGFKVLQAPDVPSVLLELGYLSSDHDVKALTSPEWREQATRSIVASVDAFFAPRQTAGGSSPAAAPLGPAASSSSASAN